MHSKTSITRYLSMLLAFMLMISAIAPAAFAQEEAGQSNATASEEEVSTAIEHAAGPVPVTSIAESVYGYSAFQHVVKISYEIGTRTAGSVQEAETRDYIAAEFAKYGYTVEQQAFSYTRKGNTINSTNVIATKPGLSSKTVIVGAHYDSVAAAKGADDNASGVGVMLEAAERLAAENSAYTLKFIAFGAEEEGLQGSKAYVAGMTDEEKANTVVMINLDSLAAGDIMYLYGSEGREGFARDQGLAIAKREGLKVTTNPGENPEFPAGTTGDWSDHAPFKAAGIPYAYMEATNWALGDKDGYTQTEQDGGIWHTEKDNLNYLLEYYPGRVDERLSTFTELLTKLLIELYEPQELQLSTDKVSMTEKRTVDVTFTLPAGVGLEDLNWTYGGQTFSEWKKWLPASDSSPAGYKGDPFITLEGTPVVNGNTVTAKITFDLVYNNKTALNGSPYRSLYPERMGTKELAVTGPNGTVVGSASIKMVPYDSYHTYDEIKPAIDEITAAAKQGRYIETRVLGQSVQGRDIYFTIMAKDEASVKQYVEQTLPAMMNDPAGLQEKIRSGELTDYKVPIWLNNIHPDEAPGVDVILNFFRTMATEDYVSYKPSGTAAEVTLHMDEVLDDAIFLFNYTENPDGRYLNTRANANGFDLNRDNSYQTQPETQIVAAEVAKWSPLSFLDMHGFVSSFLIEPCTPPHDPNMEFDLLIDSMVEQATAMGEAGIANTTYDKYHIPYLEAQKLAANPSYESPGYPTGWDDASPAYTAVYAMHHGALGHTLEIPDLNEESTKALYYTSLAATNYVIENKEKLFLNQLEVYKRGIEGVDSPSVDKHLINAKNEVIGRPRAEGESFFPDYYVLPVSDSLQKNQLEAYRMVQYLIRNGVKVEQSNAAVTAAGISYPAGTYVVNMKQAKRGFANLVLYDGINVSDFSEMYADIVQSFSYMRGFDRYVVREANVFSGKTNAVTSVTIPATAQVAAAGSYVIKNTNNDAIKAVNELLAAGKPVSMLYVAGTGYEKGDFVVSGADLNAISAKYYLEVTPFTGNVSRTAQSLRKATVAASGVPAYVLRGLGFTVTTSTNDADVLVNLGSKSLVSGGKPYIGYGYSAMNAVKSWTVLPNFDFVSTGLVQTGATSYYNNPYEGLFKTKMSQSSVITAPYEESDHMYTVSGSYIKTVPAGGKTIASVSGDSDFFVAGWWPGHEAAQGQVMAFTYRQNGVNVTIFGNDLTNRAHPQHQFRLLANAIYASLLNEDLPGSPSTGGGYVPTVPAPGTTAPGTETPAAPAPGTPAEPSKPAVPAAPQFKDLGPVEAWAAEAIAELAARGIISGTSAGSFSPLKEVTRAEFLTMLVRTLNLEVEGKTAAFSDVKNTDWYSSYIAAAVEAGLASGTGSGKFDPKRAITREEMAIMSANALKKMKDVQMPDVDGALAKFKDKDKLASYSKEPVALLTEAGVINGMTATTFQPKGKANRAQAAVIIKRMLDLQNQ
ncbi:M20/M25/M40 family metallo-hydrolase [Paenibacillus tarimensis]|uniref:M20/M25/M40 family metallo-hydrolase n=1 Tax=Paenibacillus tarimensis TaxID=416012 RepID=UPI001F4522F7|nr:M20/M25/M40 family metallo-hydrolase [Paenibacillus tarimensis]MCF2943288.1 M20/M25/M40 family metallo-hydrolase [Paenibacillus tarimensis]